MCEEKYGVHHGKNRLLPPLSDCSTRLQLAIRTRMWRSRRACSPRLTLQTHARTAEAYVSPLVDNVLLMDQVPSIVKSHFFFLDN